MEIRNMSDKKKPNHEIIENIKIEIENLFILRINMHKYENDMFEVLK